MTQPNRGQKQLMRDYVQGKGKGLDFTRYYHLLLRNFWLVVLIVGASLAAMYIWLIHQPVQYAAKTVVQVENEQQKVLGAKVDDVQPQNLSTDDYFQTVKECFTSQTLMARVARAAGLDKDPHLFPPLPNGKGYSDAEIAQVMLKRITADLRRTTRLIDITVLDEQPERAQRVSDTMVSEFVRQSVDQQYNVSRMASQFLQEEANKLKAELETAQQQLQAYKERYDALALEKSENITTDKLKEMNSALTVAKDERIKLESDMEQLKRTSPDDVAGMLQIASVAAIPQVVDIQNQIATANSELRQLLRTDLSAFKNPQAQPKYLKAQGSIDQLNNSLKTTLLNARKLVAVHYRAAKDTEDKLTAAFHDQEQAAMELTRIGIPYNVLRRQVDSDQAMYDTLMTRVRETSISSQIKSSPFHVIQEPTVATRPAKPEKLKMMLVALVFSIIFAGVVLVIQDSMDSTLRSVDEAEEFLGVHALGVIPFERQKKKGGRTLPLVALNNPTSRQAEAFRFVRASVALLGDEPLRRVFLLTSAVSDEGKTFCALNTAAAFALEGLKTVVVEADLRRPTFYKSLTGMADRKTPGLTDYLSGREDLDNVIQESHLENLAFIFAGRPARNPAELLAGNSFHCLVESLLERFDRVVVDTAPINAVSDTLSIVRTVHYVCLVVRPGRTPKKAIARACELVDKAGGKMAGLLLNRANFKIGAGALYYYYGEKYVTSKKA